MSEDIRFHIIQHAAVRIAMSHAMSHGMICIHICMYVDICIYMYFCSHFELRLSLSLAPMSLVQWSVDVSHWAEWSWWVVEDEFRSWCYIAVIPLLAWAVVRGTLAISKDVWMLMRVFSVLLRLFSVLRSVCQKVMRMLGLIRKMDQGSQTDEWEPPCLPSEIFFKDRKEVYHLRGCHYLKMSEHGTFSKRACSQCERLWNKGMLPLPL